MHTNTYSLAYSLIHSLSLSLSLTHTHTHTHIHTHTCATHIRCYHGDVLCLHTKIRVTHLMMCVSVEQYNYGFVVIH